MRQYAWLSASIDVNKKSYTRSEWNSKNGKKPRFPPKGAAGHLIDWLNDIGFYRSNGYGPCPLDFTEIKAWSDLKRITLRTDEVSLLRSFSVEFCSQLSKSKEINEPEPYNAEYSEEELAQVQKDIRAARRARVSKKPSS